MNEPSVGQLICLWSKDIREFGFSSLVGEFKGVSQYGWELRLDEDTTWYQTPETVDAWKPVTTEWLG